MKIYQVGNQIVNNIEQFNSSMRKEFAKKESLAALYKDQSNKEINVIRFKRTGLQKAYTK